MAANIGLASYVEKVNGTEHGSNDKRTDQAISFLLIIQFDISSRVLEFRSRACASLPVSKLASRYQALPGSSTTNFEPSP
jgi:hypothetical protein